MNSNHPLPTYFKLPTVEFAATGDFRTDVSSALAALESRLRDRAISAALEDAFPSGPIDIAGVDYRTPAIAASIVRQVADILESL